MHNVGGILVKLAQFGQKLPAKLSDPLVRFQIIWRTTIAVQTTSTLLREITLDHFGSMIIKIRFPAGNCEDTYACHCPTLRFLQHTKLGNMQRGTQGFLDN